MKADADTFRREVAGALGDRSAISAAVAAGLPRESIRSVLEGHLPSVERVAEICAALGLEFYVGPPRRQSLDDAILGLPLATRHDLERATQSLVRLTEQIGGEPVPGDLWPILAAKRGAGPPAPDDEDLPPDARPVSVMELAAAAGGGAEALDERPVGHVWFRRGWLDRRGLDPTQCAVIGVRGESMEPTLPDGCSILIDRTRRKPVDGRIYVVQTGDGVVVKRAGETKDGWELRSDHPSWGPAPWLGDADTIGQVVWTARSLV